MVFKKILCISMYSRKVDTIANTSAAYSLLPIYLLFILSGQICHHREINHRKRNLKAPKTI